MPAEKESVSRRLKDIREKVMGLNQAQFAKLAGVSQAFVSAWENAKDRAVPSSDAYLRLANEAPYPDSLWLREQAGENMKRLTSDIHRFLT